MILMGVDIGTSSAKAVVINSANHLLGKAQQQYSIHEPSPGHREQDPDEILHAVFKIINEALRFVPAGEKLGGVCFSSAMHSLMVVDSQGKTLTQLMMWADTRSNQEAIYLKKHGAATRLYQNCGVPIHPMTPLCKIMWLRKNEQTVFKEAYKFISIKEYLFYRLTGQFVVDHSVASATGLFNIHRLQWDVEALELAGINEDKLSEPVPVQQQFTSLESRNGAELSLPTGTPLIIGSSDGCLANIGSEVQPDNDIAVTIGTSMAVRITAAKPHADADESLFNYAVAPNLYVCGGGSNNGSLLLNWMAHSMLENKELEDPEKFMRKAMRAPAGCDGLLVLPYLLGERAPVWDADATGVITGMRFHHQQQHLMRALVEGITMNACILIDKLKHENGKIRQVKASGGFTHSADWVQMLADISNLPVVVNDEGDASAMGAIAVARVSLGLKASLFEPVDHASESVIYQPNAQLHTIYQNNFRHFKTMYTSNQHS